MHGFGFIAAMYVYTWFGSVSLDGALMLGVNSVLATAVEYGLISALSIGGVLPGG